MTDCTKCGSSRVIPILDKRMEETVRRWGGNRFRRFCKTCQKFGSFTSRDEWENHPDARILPVDADPEPGQLLDANGDELANRFACPASGCDAVHEGYPAECDVCGATYDWNEND